MILRQLFAGGTQLPVEMVAFFIAADYLVNELLCDGAFVVYQFGGFQDRLQFFYIGYFQPAHQPQQKLHVSHTGFDVKSFVACAQIVIQVSRQIVLVVESGIFALDSFISCGLQPFQGDFAAEDKAVQLIQDRKLFIGKRALEGFIHQIVLHLRPGMHQDGCHLYFKAHRRIFQLAFFQCFFLHAGAVVGGPIAGKAFVIGRLFRLDRKLFGFRHSKKVIDNPVCLGPVTGEIKGDTYTGKIGDIRIDFAHIFIRRLSFFIPLRHFDFQPSRTFGPGGHHGADTGGTQGVLQHIGGDSSGSFIIFNFFLVIFYKLINQIHFCLPLVSFGRVFRNVLCTQTPQVPNGSPPAVCAEGHLAPAEFELCS